MSVSNDKIIEILNMQINESFTKEFPTKKIVSENNVLLDWSELNKFTRKQFERQFQDIYEQKSFPTDMDYSQYGMSLTDLYELLRDEMHKEHEKTRSIVKEEVDQLKNNIIECIKDNPIATIMLFSKIIIICAIFSLTVWLTFGFSIINPLFSLMLIFSSLAGIGMSKIRRAALNKRE